MQLTLVLSFLVALATCLAIGASIGYVYRSRSDSELKPSDVTKFGMDAAAAIIAIAVGGSTLIYAHSNDQRLDQQTRTEFAKLVYLGEAPPYYSDDSGEDRNRVVYNSSGVEIRNVWVEYENGARIKIDGIQRCSLYDLPRDPQKVADFDDAIPEGESSPKVLYFSDPNGHWERDEAGPPRVSGISDIPEDAEFGESSVEEIRNCSA